MQKDLFGHDPTPSEKVPTWKPARYPDFDALDGQAIAELYLSLLQRNDRLLAAVEDHAESEIDDEALAQFESAHRHLFVGYGALLHQPIDESRVFEFLERAMAVDAKLHDLRVQVLGDLPAELAEKVDDSARHRKAKKVFIDRRAIERFTQTCDESDFQEAFVIDLD